LELLERDQGFSENSSWVIVSDGVCKNGALVTQTTAPEKRGQGTAKYFPDLRDCRDY
jgi:hypothetical protein